MVKGNETSIVRKIKDTLALYLSSAELNELDALNTMALWRLKRGNGWVVFLQNNNSNGSMLFGWYLISETNSYSKWAVNLWYSNVAEEFESMLQTGFFLKVCLIEFLLIPDVFFVTRSPLLIFLCIFGLIHNVGRPCETRKKMELLVTLYTEISSKQFIEWFTFHQISWQFWTLNWSAKSFLSLLSGLFMDRVLVHFNI